MHCVERASCMRASRASRGLESKSIFHVLAPWRALLCLTGGVL